mmetsp:Transcript_7861/g.16466  ORF Transcript_7861/g.16466 Transcript_7861/m.16466 type:complete len:217 (+) Transcript_7861:591-1241(+)
MTRWSLTPRSRCGRHPPQEPAGQHRRCRRCSRVFELARRQLRHSSSRSAQRETWWQQRHGERRRWAARPLGGGRISPVAGGLWNCRRGRTGLAGLRCCPASRRRAPMATLSTTLSFPRTLSQWRYPGDPSVQGRARRNESLRSRLCDARPRLDATVAMGRVAPTSGPRPARPCPSASVAWTRMLSPWGRPFIGRRNAARRTPSLHTGGASSRYSRS